ncbi:hypothetical protein QBC38DRAFT_548729 [Podospora fimiseda]|uniref:Uncharacterized protein n=1 Tax=Podospora fimiseda TaxID=252190 RepID=A0AAN7GRX1_9PEZI|nr:hypothetical protein QBC38DRAFT_548729 [Podospora fimiseda]
MVAMLFSRSTKFRSPSHRIYENTIAPAVPAANDFIPCPTDLWNEEITKFSKFSSTSVVPHRRRKDHIPTQMSSPTQKLNVGEYTIRQYILPTVGVGLRRPLKYSAFATLVVINALFLEVLYRQIGLPNLEDLEITTGGRTRKHKILIAFVLKRTAAICATANLQLIIANETIVIAEVSISTANLVLVVTNLVIGNPSFVLSRSAQRRRLSVAATSSPTAALSNGNVPSLLRMCECCRQTLEVIFGSMSTLTAPFPMFPESSFPPYQISDTPLRSSARRHSLREYSQDMVSRVRFGPGRAISMAMFAELFFLGFQMFQRVPGASVAMIRTTIITPCTLPENLSPTPVVDNREAKQ